MLLRRFREDAVALDLLTRPLSSVARYLAVSSAESQTPFVYLGRTAEKAPLEVDLVAGDVLAFALYVGDIARDERVCRFECHPVVPFPGTRIVPSRSGAGSLGRRFGQFSREVLAIKEISERREREAAAAFAAERRDAGMRELRAEMLKGLCRKALVLVYEFGEAVGRYEAGLEEFQSALLRGDNALLYFASLRLLRWLRWLQALQTLELQEGGKLQGGSTAAGDGQAPADLGPADFGLRPGRRTALAGGGYFRWRLHRDSELRESGTGEPGPRQHAALATSLHGISGLRALRGTAFDALVVRPFLASQERIAGEEVDPVLRKCNETLGLASAVARELQEGAPSSGGAGGTGGRLWAWGVEAADSAGRGGGAGEPGREEASSHGASTEWESGPAAATVDAVAAASGSSATPAVLAASVVPAGFSASPASPASPAPRGTPASFLAFLCHVYTEYHTRFAQALSFVREIAQ